MAVQLSSIQHSAECLAATPSSLTYSAICPAVRPSPSAACAVTSSGSPSFLRSLLAMASSVVSSLPRLPSPTSAGYRAAALTEDVDAEDPAVAATAAIAACEDEPYDLESVWIPDLEAEPGPYSIRVPEPSGDARCPRCQNRFLAVGPTGYAGEQPICDLCLLEGSKPLGMVMALAAVARTFGAADPQSEEDYRRAADELGAFARIYEIFAAKSGPRRSFRWPANMDY